MQKLLIFTDLDGSLLDHHDYSCEAARPALERIATAGFPLIFNSSKTRDEQQALRAQMKITAPYCVENGSAACVPAGSLGFELEEHVELFSASYYEIRQCLEALRNECGYAFRGFGDMTPAQVSEATGLNEESAARAQQRMGSEPLQWLGDAASRAAFVDDVKSRGFTVTEGGRFMHVMGPTDKGRGVEWLAERYRAHHSQVEWITVGIGDSPNDLPMLRVVDIPVIIPNVSGQPLLTEGLREAVVAKTQGPQGWNSAMLQVFTACGLSV